LLEKENLISKFDKDISFDRIFPCQDSVDKSGIGNLILLPLQGTAKQDGEEITCSQILRFAWPKKPRSLRVLSQVF